MPRARAPTYASLRWAHCSSARDSVTVDLTLDRGKSAANGAVGTIKASESNLSGCLPVQSVCAIFLISSPYMFPYAEKNTRPVNVRDTIITALLILIVSVAQSAADEIVAYDYRVVAVYPHDKNAFTQGLFYRDGHLYESTGLRGRSSIRQVDLETGEVLWHSWARGVCKYGVMPCNGLLYTPPHACACYVAAKLTGFSALANKRSATQRTTQSTKDKGRMKNEEVRLVKGPAYHHASLRASSEDHRPASDRLRPSPFVLPPPLLRLNLSGRRIVRMRSGVGM